MWKMLLFLAIAPGASLAQPLPPEAVISEPERDRMLPGQPGDTLMVSPSTGGAYTISVHERTQTVVGFQFANTGANRIIPRESVPGFGPDRTFNFRFESRARQNIFFSVTDAPSEYLSQLMESYIFLFPRKVLPAVEWIASPGQKSAMVVTLTTGEKVEFDGATREILSGALEETGPIDLNPDRFKRKFAKIRYRGTGVSLRVDKRGGDPRLGTTATITKGTQTCKIPSSLLFNPDESSEVEFLFPTDPEFHQFLIKKCGFGL
jgi:hypothetical protein